MNLSVQRSRFQLNWDTFGPHFPLAQWQSQTDFLYFIEVKLDAETQENMAQVTTQLQALSPNSSQWVDPADMHITIALPGRLGVHFQGNDVNNMTKKLGEIFARFNQFDLSLGNLNCFSNVLFREVYDESGHLPLLHYQICQEIPFAQAPEFQFENFLPHVSLFYAESGGKALLDHPDFDRELPEQKMTVKSIVFGRAKDEDSEIFKKEVIKEFKLAIKES